MRSIWIKAAAALLAPLVLCGAARAAGESPAGGGRLLLVGSSSMSGLMADLAKRFEAAHPGVHIEVQEGGSGRGVADAMAGKADIGMVARPLTAKESGAFSFVVARDGLAVVVNKGNPVEALSREQMQGIYTGRVANWKEVGGRDAPVAAITVSPQQGAFELFTHFLAIKPGELKAQQTIADNDDRLAAVAKDPAAIAYTSVGSAELQIRAGRPLKMLPVEGRAATSGNMRSDTYPLMRPLVLVTKAQPAGLAKEFINYALSPAATDLVKKHNFVPDND